MTLVSEAWGHGLLTGPTILQSYTSEKVMINIPPELHCLYSDKSDIRISSSNQLHSLNLHLPDGIGQVYEYTPKDSETTTFATTIEIYNPNPFPVSIIQDEYLLRYGLFILFLVQTTVQYPLNTLKEFISTPTIGLIPHSYTRYKVLKIPIIFQWNFSTPSLRPS